MKLVKLFIVTICCCAIFPISADEYFNVGTGVYDVTGPAAEVTMAGYARINMRTGGIHTRLRARAFVIEASGTRVAFVCSDLWAIPQGVKIKVVEKLQQRFGKLYTVQNVMLNATHTHSGPGGYAWYTLYNIYVFGFSQQNFDAIVDGIANAITKAHNNLAPGKIFMAQGKLENTAINRSIEAYQANIDAHLYEPCDTTMTVLKFERLTGKEIGMISWFGVHTTSVFYGNMFQGDPLTQVNQMISSDNKGWAERKFEVAKKTDYVTEEDTFIAAFANTTLGDASPNIHGKQKGGGINDYASNAISGQKQFDKAWELYHEAREELRPVVHFRHTYTDFSKVTVQKQYTDGIREYQTTYAALGIGFTAGAEDGPSELPYIDEGWYKGKYDPTHGAKIIFLETGKFSPVPWTPEVLPSQIFVVGNLAILGVPAEFTTHAGRRLKQTVQGDLEKIGVDTMIVCAPTNTFSNYVCTREEYNEQHYEGGSTLFGQWTLGAYRQQFKMLSQSLVEGTTPPAGPTPRDLTGKQFPLPTSKYDEIPLGKKFGDIAEDVPEVAEKLSVISAVFWGAHPQNTLMTNDSFFVIQRKTDEGWVDVRYDYDLDTGFLWQRHATAASKIRVIWDIPGDMESGTYRIKHSGAYKNAGSDEAHPYTGYSSEFTLIPSQKLWVSHCYMSGSDIHFRMQYPAATPFDLGEKEKYVTSGKIRFMVNGEDQEYTAQPSKSMGPGFYTATLPKNTPVNSIEIPAGFAIDADGNTNLEFSTRMK